MLPQAIFATGILTIGKILYDALTKENGECEMSCFGPDKMYRDFLLECEIQISNVVLRQRTTRRINRMILNCNGFKVGKSGNPINRVKAYPDYESMFLMASSNSEDVISALETYYNKMYISHEKNDNKRVGSAGKAISYNGIYYLYIVLR